MVAATTDGCAVPWSHDSFSRHRGVFAYSRGTHRVLARLDAGRHERRQHCLGSVLPCSAHASSARRLLRKVPPQRLLTVHSEYFEGLIGVLPGCSQGTRRARKLQQDALRHAIRAGRSAAVPLHGSAHGVRSPVPAADLLRAYKVVGLGGHAELDNAAVPVQGRSA